MPAVSNISFNVFPGYTQVRLPGVFAEVNSAAANTGATIEKSLLIGQMLSGSATANELVIVSGFANAQALFGAGSMLANMVGAYVVDDPFGELWCLPIADNGEGSAGTGTIVVAVSSNLAGTINLMIAGRQVQVGVTAGQTANNIATAIGAAITANSNLPCTASVSTNTVTLTANHKGVVAGDIPIVLNYYGAQNGQTTPTGVTLTITQFTGGATDPDLATPLASIGSATFDFICNPYVSSPDLGELELVLSPTTGQWSWLQQTYGIGFGAYKGTYSACATYGVDNNNQFVTLMAVYNTPDPVYIWAADYMAACAPSLRDDPAIPLTSLSMNAVHAPPIANQWTNSEANTLLFDGLSTYSVDQSNVVRIQRAITTYQTTNGVADASWLPVERVATVRFCVRTIMAELATACVRKKLLPDGSNIPGGSSAITPQNIALIAVGAYNELAADAEVSNPTLFAQNILWSYVPGSGQVSLMLPIAVADQLFQIALNVQFSA